MAPADTDIEHDRKVECTSFRDVPSYAVKFLPLSSVTVCSEAEVFSILILGPFSKYWGHFWNSGTVSEILKHFPICHKIKPSEHTYWWEEVWHNSWPDFSYISLDSTCHLSERHDMTVETVICRHSAVFCLSYPRWSWSTKPVLQKSFQVVLAGKHWSSWLVLDFFAYWLLINLLFCIIIFRKCSNLIVPNELVNFNAVSRLMM